MPATPSHACEFSGTEFARAIGLPFAVALACGVLTLLLHHLDVLPRPAPGTLDQTILCEKVRLAADPSPATVVLLGDSSCLMNVDAEGLANLLGESALNLGTMSHVDLAAQGELLRRHLATHPTAPTDVVVLLHPEALWRTGGSQLLGAELRTWLDRAAPPGQAGARPFEVPGTIAEWFGGRILRECLVQPISPGVLSGDFARRYGTTWEIRRELRRRRGSLDDPASYQPGTEPVRNAYRLDAAQCEGSQALRAEVGPGTRLWIGLSPLPLSATDTRHAARIRDLLSAWSVCLRPTGWLTNLPGFLPDRDFATLTHLKPEAAVGYRVRLANELRRVRGQAPVGSPLDVPNPDVSNRN